MKWRGAYEKKEFFKIFNEWLTCRCNISALAYYFEGVVFLFLGRNAQWTERSTRRSLLKQLWRGVNEGGVWFRDITKEQEGPWHSNWMRSFLPRFLWSGTAEKKKSCWKFSAFNYAALTRPHVLTFTRLATDKGGAWGCHPRNPTTIFN